MPAPVLPAPTPDEFDDLIYFSRTGDLESLQTLINELCLKHICAPSVLLASAIDIDADGLGSQSCLLHYPAANGNVEIMKYILGLIRPDTNDTSGNGKDVGSVTRGNESMSSSSVTESNNSTQSPNEIITAGVVDKAAPSLVNHKNVSGNTPLHWAGMNGHLEAVKLLVQYGADPSVVNGAGRDAVVESEMSSAKGAQECADWLLKNCAGLETGFASSGEGPIEEEAAEDVGNEEIHEKEHSEGAKLNGEGSSSGGP